MKAKPKTDGAAKIKPPNVLLAVVIPHRNRCSDALRMLSWLYTQRKNAEVLEDVAVVVMDDCSDDESPLVLRNMSESLRFHFVKPCDIRMGAGAMRNEGVNWCLTNLNPTYISFFDADDFLNEKAVGKIVTAMRESSPDYLQWGFSTVNTDPARNKMWLPKYNSPDLFYTCPPAPWLHAFKPYLFRTFPVELLTDDIVWWFEQADTIAQMPTRKAFIEEPLYIYCRTSGGCTRASDWFINHPTTLEVAARDNVCTANGFPDRYISDCIRNMAMLYDMRNNIATPEIRQMLIARLKTDFMSAAAGRFGW